MDHATEADVDRHDALPDELLLVQLLSLGLDEQRARLALLRTGNVSVDTAFAYATQQLLDSPLQDVRRDLVQYAHHAGQQVVLPPASAPHPDGAAADVAGDGDDGAGTMPRPSGAARLPMPQTLQQQQQDLSSCPPRRRHPFASSDFVWDGGDSDDDDDDDDDDGDDDDDDNDDADMVDGEDMVVEGDPAGTVGTGAALPAMLKGYEPVSTGDGTCDKDAKCVETGAVKDGEDEDDADCDDDNIDFGFVDDEDDEDGDDDHGVGHYGSETSDMSHPQHLLAAGDARYPPFATNGVALGVTSTRSLAFLGAGNTTLVPPREQVGRRTGRVNAVVDVLDMNALYLRYQSQCEGVACILNVSTEVAAALLKKHHWNRERALELALDDPSVVQVYCSGQASAAATSETPTTRAAASTDCPVCCDDQVPLVDMLAPACQHAVCIACWTRYLTQAVSQQLGEMLQCMQPSCHVVLPDALLRTALSPEDYQRHREFQLHAFVDVQPRMKWCPGRGCQRVIAVDVMPATTLRQQVRCHCGLAFCFACHDEAHAPATCEQMAMWQETSLQESQTFKWMAEHTKDCPKCETAIEKNGGCNHMRCSKCGHHFCWLCLRSWDKHTGCNRFVASTANPQRLVAGQSRRSVDHYVHYFLRYSNHEASREKEKLLRHVAKLKMRELQRSQPDRWMDVRFLDEATEILIECRRTLQYTYVFAFYQDDGPEKTLFEYLQEQLEAETERLSYALEQRIEEMQRSNVIDIGRVAMRRLSNLLRGVEDGLTSSASASSSHDPSHLVGDTATATAAATAASDSSKRRAGRSRKPRGLRRLLGGGPSADRGNGRSSTRDGQAGSARSAGRMASLLSSMFGP